MKTNSTSPKYLIRNVVLFIVFSLFLYKVTPYIVTFFTTTLERPALEKSRKLPPTPPLFTRDKTLLGVDTNNNGVRDEVERHISRYIPSSSDGKDMEYLGALAYARSQQRFLSEWEAGRITSGIDVERLNKSSDCTQPPFLNRQSLHGELYDTIAYMGLSSYTMAALIDDTTFNTKKRRNVMVTINHMDKTYFLEGVDPCNVK